ncbi:helix-turn-helix domain-containing protein [Acinetobacter haemolyticus]|uniref:helix-turn-helix domain-containing protein n=1 Tax=Acinetobacter haemolyticus TaxID=29430 RepID=UPI000F758758|nr:helix-turn-helix domain-containing protein [Acinetobacter haemolyticus]AZN67307.1 helix-turn-helix domain-containing protein [Acinetobacter haemolyticus]
MRAYSLDLRKKVMQAYRRTKHKANVCKQFNISRTTLDNWIKLEQTTQDLTPIPAIRIGRACTIKNLESFKAFVETTPFTQISDLLEPFEEKFGYRISYSILWRGLEKIGKVRKRQCSKTKR